MTDDASQRIREGFGEFLFFNGEKCINNYIINIIYHMSYMYICLLA